MSEIDVPGGEAWSSGPAACAFLRKVGVCVRQSLALPRRFFLTSSPRTRRGVRVGASVRAKKNAFTSHGM